MKRILILLTVATLASCGGKKETTTEQLTKLKKERAVLDEKIHKLEGNTKDSVKRTPVTVVEVQPGAFNSFIEVQSSITGDESVNATPQAIGTIKSVLVHTGQHVSKGQLLATMDAAAQEQNIAGIDAQVNFLKSVYEKQQKLWAQQIGTEIQLMKAKADYENIVRQRAAALANRNLWRIISPISGVVDQVNIKVGDAAAPGGFGIHVVSSDKLKAEANLGESYLGKVKAGDPVILVFSDSGDSLRTSLTYVEQVVDPISRAFKVQIRLGANAKLHPNMSCKMKIANYQNSSVITVPINAVQKTGKGDLVYVAAGNIAKAVTVQTGRSSNGLIEILSGLKAGDRVITEGYQDLDEGSAIVVN